MWVESDVRAAVEDVGREVALIAGPDEVGSGPRLEATWGRLLALLALGPAPERRTCPHCGGVGMLAATRCGSCWKTLAPLPAPVTTAHGAP